MLIIDGNSVYEIDEECAKRKKVPKECGIYEKMLQQNKGKKQESPVKNQKVNYPQ